MSGASNLVSGDNNETNDVFVLDLLTEATRRVSVSSAGAEGNNIVESIDISGDGEKVAFTSWATNLVPGDTNGVPDVFVHDLQTTSTFRASILGSGTQGNHDSYEPSLSYSGNRVAFTSNATNWYPGSNDGEPDIFLRDLSDQTTKWITSGAYWPSVWAGSSTGASISNDGRLVAYQSGRNDLDPETLNPWGYSSNVFVTNVDYGVSRNASATPDGIAGNDFSFRTAISGNGRYVAFRSTASNLVENDTNDTADIFRTEAPPDIPDHLLYGPGSGIHGMNPSATVGDPVNTGLGSYVAEVSDLSLPGLGLPFKMVRSYTSADVSSGSLGQGWTHSYMASLVILPDGRVELHGENGQRINYTFVDGEYETEAGGLSTLEETQNGYKITRRDQVIYLFDQVGNLTLMEDKNGNEISLLYDSAGRIDALIDSVGRRIEATHDSSGHLTQLSLPDGRNVRYAYSGDRLILVTDPNGGETHYSYNDTNLLTKVIDANNHTIVENTYGQDGRIESQTDALGQTTNFAWDPQRQTSTMTDSRGHIWTDYYQDNVLMKRQDPLGNTTRYGWNEDLELVHLTDPRGKTTTLAYDDAGNLKRRVAPKPLSYVETLEYDSTGNLVAHVDGRGSTTTYEYDSQGNLIEETRPGDITTTFLTDNRGKITSTTDPRGNTWVYGYDANGNLVSTTSPNDHTVTRFYDTSGRMTSLVEARGNEGSADPDDYRWTFAYDDLDRLVSRLDPLGNESQWTFDPVSNLSSFVDAMGRTTEFGYDNANQPTSVRAPDNSVTASEYDATGNMVIRTDALLRDTNLTYDAANRLATKTSPGGRVTSYEYDPVGNLQTVVTPSGNSTVIEGDGQISLDYDALNRAANVAYSDDTPDVSYEYDANGNRTAMLDGAGTETYTYDDLDRLTQVSRGGEQFTYTYDLSGNVTGRSYPDGTETEYTFNGSGLLKSIIQQGLTTDYTYDPDGRMTAMNLPSSNGHTEHRTYDRAGRLSHLETEKASIMLTASSYTYDDVGNPIEVIDDSAAVTQYEYNSRNMLTEVCNTPPCSESTDDFTRYEYDTVGNQLRQVRPTGETTLSYNANDELQSTTGPGGVTSFGWNENGLMTARGDQELTYDLSNRLRSITDGASVADYTYDGNGNRLRESTGPSPSEETNYMWDQNLPLPQLAVTRDGNEDVSRAYTYGLDLHSVRSETDDPSYYHHDGLGSVTAVTSPSGATEWEYEYDSFGNTLSAESTSSAPMNPFRFAGEYHDETGIYNLRARLFDPSIGRFLAPDPWPHSSSQPLLSPYVYADNRPTLLVDPSGLWTFAVCVGGGVGIITGFYVQACVGSDGDGIDFSGSAGTGAQSPAIYGGIQGQITTADDWCELQGDFGYAGATVGPFSGDFISGGHKSSGQRIIGGELGFGMGIPVVEGHAGSGETSAWEISDSNPNPPSCSGSIYQGKH